MTGEPAIRERLAERIVELVEAKPDQLNPTEPTDGECVYTAADDPTHHCIIGELAVAEGWPVPGVDSDLNCSGAETVAVELHWPVDENALEWLVDLQRQFDLHHRTWSLALKVCRESGLLPSTKSSSSQGES